MADATGALVSRRIKAKQLLLEIQDRLGKDVLNTIIELIQDYEENPLDAKGQLAAVLGNDRDLEERTWAFFSSAPCAIQMKNAGTNRNFTMATKN